VRPSVAEHNLPQADLPPGLPTVSEVYRQQSDLGAASDFIDRALFAFERAFVPAFNISLGTARLDFGRIENRGFFLALTRDLQYVLRPCFLFSCLALFCGLALAPRFLGRRGCWNTSFHFAKLLLSIDPYSDVRRCSRSRLALQPTADRPLTPFSRKPPCSTSTSSRSSRATRSGCSTLRRRSTVLSPRWAPEAGGSAFCPVGSGLERSRCATWRVSVPLSTAAALATLADGSSIVRCCRTERRRMRRCGTPSSRHPGSCRG
jgi:hypothetical protein